MNRCKKGRRNRTMSREFGPRVEEMEPRWLPSVTSWFNAPWRAFDTDYYPSGFGPGSIAVGDLNGDSSPDVVVGNDYFGGPGLSVLRNKGDGTYGAPQIIKLSINQTIADVVLIDIDQDGDLDVLATMPHSNGFSNQLLVFRNSGNGVIARRGQKYATGTGPLAGIVFQRVGASARCRRLGQWCAVGGS